jgi:L-fucose mutarotase/ribose pyranase (RbsD/FucU family)
MAKKQLLPKEAAEVLTEESVGTIEGAIKDKIELQVEAALTQQDDLYAEKLKELVTAIDKDHTSKLNRVVEAVDTNNANKLLKVVKRYENELNHKASGFKETLVESISDYLEEYVDEAIPAKAILEATQNRTAKEVLANLRKVLAVDSTLMSESVKEAVVDGKSQINDLSQKVQKLEKENKLLKEAYTTTKADLLLESKTAHLTGKKKEYMIRILSDKSPKFIEENFDYTQRLFDKKEKERLSVIKEEAFKKHRKVRTDAPRPKISEKKKEVSNPYLEELQRRHK